MRPLTMILVVGGLAVLLAVAEGRYYKKVNNDYVAYDWVRSKRQSHPDSTIARIPQIPFADPASNEASPALPNEAVPAPAEYLTPPAPDSQLTPQQPPPPQWNPANPAPQQAGQQNRWDLGFDAGDVLVPPPSDQGAEYDTLRLFTLVPKTSRPADEEFGPADEESAADSRTPFIDSYHPRWNPPADDAAQAPSNKRESAADRTPFVDSYHPQWKPPVDDAAQAPSDKPPVYTFVKTDPHGHFKWGVHIGH